MLLGRDEIREGQGHNFLFFDVFGFLVCCLEFFFMLCVRWCWVMLVQCENVLVTTTGVQRMSECTFYTTSKL